jgi:DUF971 family protein
MAVTPVGIKLRKTSNVLELSYADGMTHSLPAELLRVYSPSAEVKGHGKGQEVLQSGKRDVRLTGITAIGHYAVQLSFDDGHDSGIYSWEYLYHLAVDQQALWQDYEQRLAAAGRLRDAVQVIKIMDPPQMDRS